MFVFVVIFLHSFLWDEEVAHFFIVNGVRGFSWILIGTIMQNFPMKGHVGL